MSLNTPYEVTIAEKLQQLPLPDMADAIWARVERQLDIDLPADDGNGGSPSSPSGSGWIGGAALALFVAVLFFVILKREKTTPALTLPKQNNTVISTPGTQTVESNKGEGNNVPLLVTPEVVPNNLPGQVNSPPARIDSVVGNLPLPQPDSTQTNTVLLPPPQVVTDSVKPSPGRGVRGISDGDYRIVPTKKDTL